MHVYLFKSFFPFLGIANNFKSLVTASFKVFDFDDLIPWQPGFTNSEANISCPNDQKWITWSPMKKLGRIRAAVKSRTKRLSFCALQNAREFQRGKSQPLCVISVNFFPLPRSYANPKPLSTERDIFFGWQKQHEDTPLFSSGKDPKKNHPCRRCIFHLSINIGKKPFIHSAFHQVLWYQKF